MKNENKLFCFENKYPFLYDFVVGGVPVYTCLRDSVALRLRDGKQMFTAIPDQAKDKVSVRRILESYFKKRKCKKKQTLIFTSTVYRRDGGRNLAAEFLLDKYPNAVVFEWPSRNDVFDKAYFSDVNKNKYCPLDYFSLKSKVYNLFHKKEYAKIYEKCKQELFDKFNGAVAPVANESQAIKYLLDELPQSFATTVVYQKLFAKYFKNFKSVEFAIDFWGGARENVIPALKGNPRSVELQHGIIGAQHSGYVYPKFVKDLNLDFFKRQLLVYGQATKKLLYEKSIFEQERIEVIGNPRIKKYKEINLVDGKDRNLILFASQSYEQDGAGANYYSTVIQTLQKIDEFMRGDAYWKKYVLAVKLHPRENVNAKELYLKSIENVQVFGSDSPLYETLNKTKLQLTVSSTTLYEGAEFDAPTVCVKYADVDAAGTYGFEVMKMEDEKSIAKIMNRLKDENKYNEYLKYLKNKTKEYM